MLHATCFAPSLSRATSPFLSLMFKFPLQLFPRNSRRLFLRHSYRSSVASSATWVHRFPMDGRAHLCTAAIAAKKFAVPASDQISNKAKKKARRESPEGVLRYKLDMCSKHGDLVEALHLYDEARREGVQLSQYHYNVILYLCSSGGSSVEVSGDWDGEKDSVLGLKRGFDIFGQMVADKVAPNEATFTSIARLAVAMDDPDKAFDLVKQMTSFGIPPKLRSYGPALFGFCKKGKVDNAYEVDAHMVEAGVMAEEPELSALLKVSADGKKADKVYEMLQRLRATVRQVSESTAEIVEDWFKSDDAATVGVDNWDENLVKEGIVKGGGGWHGQGWLGTGKWNVVRTQMNEKGVCRSCGEKLVCIDINPTETENFATSLTNLACQREVRADFTCFQTRRSGGVFVDTHGCREWLETHGPFDAVIDGANVGLINQHTLSFNQLNNVVNQLREMSPSKRLPLVILHKSRATGGPAQKPKNKYLLESWKKSGALYATPPGSNDDWYWLYASVSCKCLLVTNDEMRDHLFQLLGTSFFPRWKEKHQIRLSVSRNGLKLHMPPPYSIVIQESENGSWHVPTTTGDDLQTSRQWLCATRTRLR